MNMFLPQTIGLADMNNQPVPIKGDVGVLRAPMWYAVELCCTAAVPGGRAPTLPLRAQKM